MPGPRPRPTRGRRRPATGTCPGPTRPCCRPRGIAFLRGGVPDDEAGQRAEDVQSSGQGEARGRIVEEGTHDELLRPGGRYAESGLCPGRPQRRGRRGRRRTVRPGPRSRTRRPRGGASDRTRRGQHLVARGPQRRAAGPTRRPDGAPARPSTGVTHRAHQPGTGRPGPHRTVAARRLRTTCDTAGARRTGTCVCRTAAITPGGTAPSGAASPGAAWWRFCCRACAPWSAWPPRGRSRARRRARGGAVGARAPGGRR
ncbi:hypothetical protein RKD30_004089 [Streptomyces pristinaespiralis]